MSETLTSSPQTAPETARDVVAIVDVDELEAARRDPRVHAFHADADRLLAELEREGRNL